jgi:hypothetical protein
MIRKKYGAVSMSATNETLQMGAAPSDWLKEMETHFSQNGFYRPEDLMRVFGDRPSGENVPIIPDDAAAQADRTGVSTVPQAPSAASSPDW